MAWAVPVLQENQVIGKTSGSGYHAGAQPEPLPANQMNIDTSSLPLDARIISSGRAWCRRARPACWCASRSRTYEAASVILQGADGKPLAAGTTVLHVSGGARWWVMTAWRLSTTCKR
jgi:outer membrane usher protein